jgi:hypothetical protein
MKKKKIDFNLVYPALVVVFLLFQLLFLTKAPSIMEDEPQIPAQVILAEIFLLCTPFCWGSA